MLFAWMLTLHLKITSFVIEFCKINTFISVDCSHFKGTYICKLSHHQNIASYIYTLLHLLWNCHPFSLFSGETCISLMGHLYFFNILLALRQSGYTVVAEWVQIYYQKWKRNSICHVITNFGLVRCKAEINLL